MPTKDEVELEAFKRQVAEILERMKRIERMARRAMRRPTRSIEREFDDELDEAADLDELDFDEEE